MSNWWVLWAERIALVLAEWWTRTRADGVGDRGVGTEGPGAAPADRPMNPDAPPEPDAPAPQ